MTKKKELLDNQGAIEDLKAQLKQYTADYNALNSKILKTQGALEVLEQLEKGVEIPNDSESTN